MNGAVPLALSCALLGPGGSRVDTLEAGGEVRLCLAADSGASVRGWVDGPGSRLALREADGNVLRELSDGRPGLRSFAFPARGSLPLVLELSARAGGVHRLGLEAVVPSAPPSGPEPPRSPALRALSERPNDGRILDSFWLDVARRGTPLIEAVEGLGPGEKLATFLWRGDNASVTLFSAPSGDHEPMRRLPGSDVWYWSAPVPEGAWIAYRIAPDVPLVAGHPRERRMAILATARRDPLNPRAQPADAPDPHLAESLMELPGAPPADPGRPVGAPTGTVETFRIRSALLGDERRVHLVRTADWRPNSPDNALLLAFDGDEHLERVPVSAILDRLRQQGRIPPTAALLVGNAPGDARSRQLPPDTLFARFLSEELLPWADSMGLAAAPERTIAAGESYGGLAATWAALRCPGRIGKVLALSGSFWWSPSGDPEPEWLTRVIAAAPSLPIAFHLEAGSFEGGERGILQATRHLRDVLVAKGCRVTYRQRASGHGWEHWNRTFADAFATLVGSGNQ